MFTVVEEEQKNQTDHTSSWGQLLHPEVYRPFRLLMVYLFFANLLSGIQYSPYLVSVFEEFGAPVNIELTLVRNFWPLKKRLYMFCVVIAALHFFMSINFSCLDNIFVNISDM